MLARSVPRSLPAFRSAAVAPRVAIAATPRTVTTLAKNAYTAHGRATGAGRDGHAGLVNDKGGLEVSLGLPRELGGSGAGNNPEELFSLGYSACFLSALRLVARNAKEEIPADTAVDALVHIGPPSGGQGFALAVDLSVSASYSDKQKFQKLVDEAHQVCPYSNAIKGNVPVTVKVE
ncbi:unnamed protein product [Sympodiomycopsis kandeliae]